MNKRILEQIIGDTGLAEKPKNTISGNYRGYDMVIKLEGQMGFSLAVNGKTNEDSGMVSELVNKIREKKSVTSCTYMNNFIKVFFNLKKGYVDAIHECMNEITSYFQLNNYANVCQVCNENDKRISLCKVQGGMQYLCDDCFGAAVEQTASESTTKKRGNVATGIIGAILGSLLGVAAWVIVYQLGFIAGLAGLAIAVCTIKGYEMLGGKMNKTGIIISIIITVIMIYFAQTLSYTIELYQLEEFNEYATFFQIYRFVNELIFTNSEVMSETIKDFLIAYGLTAVASYSTFKNTLNKNVESLKVEKY